jgi:hypothetical protein
MATEIRCRARHHDEVPDTRRDLPVAARTDVALRRFVGLQAPNLDVFEIGREAAHASSAHSTRPSARMSPAATNK